MKKIVFCLLLISLFLFSSCENFLNGNEVKNQLETYIDYVNLPYTAIEIKSDAEATNSIVPAIGNYNDKYKKGDEISLKFETKENYLFLEWYCEPAGSIKFANEKDSNTTAVILDGSKNIVIYPKTFLIPKIVDFYPSYVSGGVPQDTGVYVKFNKPVKAEDFSDFSRISILCDSKELKDEYFITPKLSEDGKTLSILRKPGTFIINSDENGSYKDLVVTFSLTDITDDVENEKIHFKENKTFTYRINKNHDKDAPIVLSSLTGAKNIDNLNSEIEEKQFYHGAYEVYGKSSNKASLIERNHVGNKIYFKVQLKDVDSGVRSIILTEKMIYDKNSQSIADPQEYITEFFSADNDICSVSKEEGIYSFNFEYTFMNSEDGLIRLTANAYDYSGNEVNLITNENCYDLIKDTSAPTVTIYKNSIETVFGDEEYKVLVTITEDTTSYFIKGFDDTLYKKFNTSDILKVLEQCLVTILFSSDGENWTEGYDQNEGISIPSDKTIDYQYKYKAFLSTHHRDSTKDFYIKAIVKDDYGNIFEKQEKLQRNILITEFVDSSYQFYTNCEPEESYNVYLKFKNEDGLFIHLFDNKYMNAGKRTGSDVNYLKKNELNKYKVTDKTQFDIYLVPLVSNLSFSPSVNTSFSDSATSSSYYSGVDADSGWYVRDIYKENPFLLYSKGTVKFYPKDNLTNTGAITGYKCPLYGSLSQPYGVPSQNTGEGIPSEVIPMENQIKLVRKPLVPNSNLFSYQLEYENFKENSNYTYVYKLKNNSDVVYFSDRMNFDYKYSEVDISVIVIDNSGNKKESNSVHYDGIDADTTAPDTIYALSTGLSNFSNRGLAHFSVYPDKCVSLFSINDTANGKNSTGSLINTVQYWFSNNGKFTDDDLKLLSYETAELDSNGKLTIYYNKHNERYLYIKASDKKGNYRILKNDFARKYTAWKKVKNDTSSKILTLIVPVDNQRCRNCKVYVYNAKNNTLLNSMYEDGCLINEDNKNVDHYGTNIKLNIDTESYDANYIKITNVYDTGIPVNSSVVTTSSGYPFVEYIYVPFINKSDPECNLKDVQFGAKGMSVFSEKPVFVHTMYGPENLEDKVMEWECKATEVKFVEKDSSFTYTIPTNIPSNNWYTTIVHFADGDFYQTEPVWKQ